MSSSTDSNIAIPVTCVLCENTFDALFVRAASYGLCSRCWSKDTLREWDRLVSAKRHAERAGRPATLHLKEWLDLVTAYKGDCALCRTYSYREIGLLDVQKGVISGNCFPCCGSCSVHLVSGFEHALERVQVQIVVPTLEEEV